MEISVKISRKNGKLQDARKAAGLSQSQLAREAGISVRILQEYEQGARNLSGAKLATLLKLCNALHCALQDIITDTQTLALLDEYMKIWMNK